MKGAISWFTRVGFGQGKVKTAEVNALKQVFNNNSDLRAAVKSIKLETSSSYYRNLEHRITQTQKKTTDLDAANRLNEILNKVRQYNWGAQCNDNTATADPQADPPQAPDAPPQPGTSQAPDEPPQPGTSQAPDAPPQPGTSQAPDDPAQADDPQDPNNPQQAGPSGQQPVVRSKECIRTLTKQEAKKFKKAEKDKLIEWNEIDIAEHNLHGTLPRFYRKDPMGNIHHMGRSPNKTLTGSFQDNLDITGGSKMLVAKDSEYVQLNLHQKIKQIEAMSFNELAINKLREYPSISQSFFANTNRMIAHNGGASLGSLLVDYDPPQLCSMPQFKQLVTDLCMMQQQQIYITDMKPDNLVCPEGENSSISLVDLDSMCCENYNLILSISHGYLTKDLYEAHHESSRPLFDPNEIENRYINRTDFPLDFDKKKFHQANANIANYALINTMIEATTGVPCSNLDPVYLDAEHTLSEFSLWNAFPLPIGVRPQQNFEDIDVSKATRSWIKEHVKKVHQAAILQFVSEPHLHQGQLKLNEMLKFTKSPVFTPPTQVQPQAETQEQLDTRF